MHRATVLLSSATRNAPRSGLKKPTLSFEHFVQRQRALGLWREIVRATQKIKDLSIRHELRTFAREEFERNRNVTDLTHVQYLISTGKTEFNTMRRYIDEHAS